MSALRRLAVLPVSIALLLPGTSAATAAPVKATVDTAGHKVGMRDRQEMRATRVGRRADGRKATLRCVRRGSMVNGHVRRSDRWYKLRNGAWVPGAQLRLPKAAAKLRTCRKVPFGDDYFYRSRPVGRIDAWRFYSRYCTSFAAWRANQMGPKFSNFSHGQHYSNAENWDNAARAAGIPVNRRPRRGAIAQWDPGVNGASYAGHVGFVRRVFRDGDVLIEEYNWTTARGYGRRRIPARQVSHFIHFGRR